MARLGVAQVSEMRWESEASFEACLAWPGRKEGDILHWMLLIEMLAT